MSKHDIFPKNKTIQIFLMIGFVLLLGLTAVVATLTMSSPAESNNAAGSQVVHQQNTPDPLVQLNGEWAGTLNSATFVATVEDHVITIHVTNGGQTMIYWCGSFGTQEAVGSVITSNKVEIPKAVLSTADSKNFTVMANALVFEFTMMGKTQNVQLSRN
jgi:hypothetical protein